MNWQEVLLWQYSPAALLLFVGVLFKLGFLPYVSQRGSGSWSNAFKVNIQEEEYLEKSGNDEEGVTNQERTDWMIRWLVPGLLFMPLCLSAEYWWLWFPATAIGTLWAYFSERQFDLFGHTVEIITVDNPEYEYAEINRMIKHSEGFRGMTHDQVQKLVDSRKPLARLWKRIML